MLHRGCRKAGIHWCSDASWKWQDSKTITWNFKVLVLLNAQVNLAQMLGEFWNFCTMCIIGKSLERNPEIGAVVKHQRIFVNILWNYIKIIICKMVFLIVVPHHSTTLQWFSLLWRIHVHVLMEFKNSPIAGNPESSVTSQLGETEATPTTGHGEQQSDGKVRRLKKTPHDGETSLVHWQLHYKKLEIQA